MEEVVWVLEPAGELEFLAFSLFLTLFCFLEVGNTPLSGAGQNLKDVQRILVCRSSLSCCCQVRGHIVDLFYCLLIGFSDDV